MGLYKHNTRYENQKINKEPFFDILIRPPSVITFEHYKSVADMNAKMPNSIVPDAKNCDNSKVVFNNGKWSSYTPQQLKRPKTTKLSCMKTVQNKKYISVNYLLMEEKLNFVKLQKEKFIEEHNKNMEIYQKKVQLLDLQINALDNCKSGGTYSPGGISYNSSTFLWSCVLPVAAWASPLSEGEEFTCRSATCGRGSGESGESIVLTVLFPFISTAGVGEAAGDWAVLIGESAFDSGGDGESLEGAEGIKYQIACKSFLKTRFRDAIPSLAQLAVGSEDWIRTQQRTSRLISITNFWNRRDQEDQEKPKDEDRRQSAVSSKSEDHNFMQDSNSALDTITNLLENMSLNNSTITVPSIHAAKAIADFLPYFDGDTQQLESFIFRCETFYNTYGRLKLIKSRVEVKIQTDPSLTPDQKVLLISQNELNALDVLTANKYFCKHEDLLEADPCLVEIIKNGRNTCPITRIQQSRTLVQQISSSKVIICPREPTTVHSSCPEDGLIVISQPSLIELQRCSLEINQHKFYPSDRIDHETIFPLPAISLTNFMKQNLVDVIKFNLKTIQNLQISQEQINEHSIQFPDRPIEKTNLIIFLLLLSTFIGYIIYQILKKLREARRRREEEAVPDSQTLDPPFAHLRQGGVI
ncbi:unnamed protein product [Acanthoscelides obtectus]|uniref:Uncharacterized protein n=1 Tax=Acanthoscelides obtectus TaxID=200917 RepID=A0A9P0JLE2_ACAOB|nr:unnamed protein product [Acanthoscelides obtectus]CAK1672790.1 hypothetical protein AOBTE_LOCUS29089 [Acanthoscelides obtectus]